MLAIRPARSVLAAALIAVASFATAAEQSPPIEKEMTPEQFKGAGLDLLSPEQLANLNAWLNRKITTETKKAANLAEDKIKTENRGYFNFGTSEPIVSKLVGEFKGFRQGRQYVLENGQEWVQNDQATLAGVRLSNPQVKVEPSAIGNAWYLSVEGYNTRAKVSRSK
ncbi:MAG TPA: hypothetical protein VM555_11700 [Tahibacter sp.]|nr:hypothetical protein [Tahibacter sp.]